MLLLVAKTQELEKEAHEKSQELRQLKSQGDLEKTELRVSVEEEDTMTQSSDHEGSLQLDWSSFSPFDPQDPDKAFTLVRSVLTRRQQAVQMRSSRAAPQPPGTSLESGDLWSPGLGISDLYFRGRELLQKVRAELQQQLEVLEQEAWRLWRANVELQLQGDSAQGEKQEQQEELHMAVHERERLQEMLVSMEAKQSESLSELITLREALESSRLEGELLRQEQVEVTVALSRAEQSIADLSASENSLKAEVADLRAAAVKLGALNEALALDKVGLNQKLLQLQGGFGHRAAEAQGNELSPLSFGVLHSLLILASWSRRTSLCAAEWRRQSGGSRVEAAEHLRSALQVDLAEAEREALWEKKTQLQAQLQKAEETGAELQGELKSV
ncbi:Centrosome-associated protein CEP250 [Lemmus lemmus]